MFRVAAAVVVFSLVGGRREFWGDRNAGWWLRHADQCRAPVTDARQQREHQSGRQRHALRSSRTQARTRQEDRGQRTGAGRHSRSPAARTPKKPSPRAASVNKYREKQIDQPNQIYSSQGQRLVSPMIGQPGSGGIGVGQGSPFGDRYGYYVDILRQKVAQNWRTGDVDPRIRTAPPAIVTFTIRRDGSTAGRTDRTDQRQPGARSVRATGHRRCRAVSAASSRLRAEVMFRLNFGLS